MKPVFGCEIYLAQVKYLLLERWHLVRSSDKLDI